MPRVHVETQLTGCLSHPRSSNALLGPRISKKMHAIEGGCVVKPEAGSRAHHQSVTPAPATGSPLCLGYWYCHPQLLLLILGCKQVLAFQNRKEPNVGCSSSWQLLFLATPPSEKQARQLFHRVRQHPLWSSGAEDGVCNGTD